MRATLQADADALIGDGQKRPALFFRGMYFCGDAIERVSEKELEEERTSGARSTVRLSSEVATGESDAGHNLVFLKSLFKERIFREAGLARPVARVRVSRDRRVVMAQAAALVFLVGGGFGLWTALNGYRSGDVVRTGLRQDAEEVAAVLAGMAAGVESIVLPVSRQRLEERIARLLGTGDRGPDTTFAAYTAGDPRSLTDYLRDVKTLSRNIQRYNTLATRDSGSVTQLAELLEYLFGERPLERDSSFTSADFQWALREASAPRGRRMAWIQIWLQGQLTGQPL